MHSKDSLMAIDIVRLQQSSYLLESLNDRVDFSHLIILFKLQKLLMMKTKMIMILTINLLLQVADNLPDCDPFSYENSMFLYYQTLFHIYYIDIP